LYFLAVLVLNITIATKAFAYSENIFSKAWHAMTKSKVLRLIDTVKYKDNKKFQDMTAVAWSPDGRWIATTGFSRVTIWDAATLSIRHDLEQEDKGSALNNITFSPDSKYLASGVKSVSIWKVTDGTLVTSLIAPHVTPDPPYTDIRSLRFSPDGKMLMIAYRIGLKCMVSAYRTKDWQLAWTYEPQDILEPPNGLTTPNITPSLAFTPDSKNVILGTGEEGTENVNFKRMSRVLILDAQSGKLLRSIDDIHVLEPTALTVSPNGKLVATGTCTGQREQRANEKANQMVTVENKDPVRIWNLETGKLVRELPVHYEVNYLTFSKDGKYLFGALSVYSTSIRLIVWDVASGKIVQEVKENTVPMVLALSPDGKKLAEAALSRLSIYQITTGN
jgi:WD40 repeat protein